MILLDTDHLSVLLDERDANHASLVNRLQQANDVPAVPVVCIEEQLLSANLRDFEQVPGLYVEDWLH